MNKTSPRMLRAIELIKDGTSVPKAARIAGVTHPAVYMSPLYKAVLEERESRGIRVRRSPFRTRP